MPFSPLTAALVVACAATLSLVAVTTVRTPSAAFRLFLALAPFNYFYVALFGWSVSWGAAGAVAGGGPAAVKFAKDAVFLLILLMWLAWHALAVKEPVIPSTGAHRAVCAFLAYQAVMFLPGALSLGAVPAAIAFWQNVGYAGAYFIGRRLIVSSGQADHRRWLDRLVWVAVIVAGLGALQYWLLPDSTFRYSGGPYAGFRRITSTMGSPNNLGMFLAFALVADLILDPRLMKNTMRRTLMFIILLMTASMSAIGAFVLAAGAFMAFRSRWRGWLRMLLILAVLLVGVTTAFPTVGQRLLAVATLKDESLIIRLENWRKLTPPPSLRLVTGSGLGTGGSMTVSFQGGGALADSQYLAILIQSGILGLGLLTVAVGLAMMSSLRDGMELQARRVAFAIVLMTLMFGLIVNVLNVFPINLYFWTALGVLTLPSVRKKCRGPRVKPSQSSFHTSTRLEHSTA